MQFEKTKKVNPLLRLFDPHRFHASNLIYFDCLLSCKALHLHGLNIAHKKMWSLFLVECLGHDHHPSENPIRKNDKESPK